MMLLLLDDPLDDEHSCIHDYEHEYEHEYEYEHDLDSVAVAVDDHVPTTQFAVS